MCYILRSALVVSALVLGLLLTGCQTRSMFAVEGLGKLTVGPNDDRRYQAVMLDNGLRVILIQDKDVDRSAAAMAVSVGSYDEPAEREGLAHFLEHMLFLGTKRYPDPEGFMSFIAANGGQNNAYTASDHTNYFFEIGNVNFAEALDRFGQFFIAPLFDATYVDKERNAVHSEYQLQSKDDNWRISSVQRISLNPNHPAARFNIGSQETLADKDTKVRNDLIRFYEQHYRANRMVLTVLSSYPLRQQLHWVRLSFNDIPPSDEPPLAVSTPLFVPDQLPAMLTVKPEKELRTLAFDFPVPAVQPHYRAKPVHYIANLLGTEAEGSLHAWLKKKGWIEALSASGGPLWRQDSFISVNMTLTEAGSQHWQEVGDALFAYIRLLKSEGVERWRFFEESQLLSLQFRFQQRPSPLSYVRQIATNALQYPLLDSVYAPYAMLDWSPELITEYLDLLTPERALMTHVDPVAKTDSVEHWFKVHYQLGRIPQPAIDSWHQAALPDGIHLPALNQFIPENLQLAEVDSAAQLELLPVQGAQAWHYPDISFELPHNILYFSLKNNQQQPTAKQRATIALYLALAREALNEYGYPAVAAGLSYSVTSNDGGMLLSISGYSDNQSKLLAELMQAVTKTRIDPERVMHYQTELSRRWRNSLKDRPYVRNLVAVSDALLTPKWRAQEMAAAVESLSLQDIIHWRDDWFADIELAAFLYGNLDRQQAMSMVNSVTSALSSRADTQPAALQLVKLAGLGGIVHQEAVDHTDAAMVLYVQGANQSMSERAKFALLSQMLRADYFQHVRTEKQLGYVAAARSRLWVKTPGLAFIVQSPVASAPELLDTTLAFLDNYGATIERLTPAVFQGYKKALSAAILIQDKNPDQRASRLWQELRSGELKLDSRERLVKAIAVLHQEDVELFYERFVEAVGNRSFISYSEGKTQEAIKASVTRQPLTQFYSLKQSERDRFVFFNQQ